MAKLKKLFLVFIILLIPRLSYAQLSCQNTVFASLPATPFAQEACSITNDTGCVNGVAAAGGGGITCPVYWNGTAWINFTNIPGGGSGSVSTLTIGSDNLVNSMARMPIQSFVDATAATTTVPFGCSLLTKAVTFENVQFTVTAVTQTVAPSLSLCDTGTTANPVACGTTIVNSGTFTAAGNTSLTTMTNANVAAGHFVCSFFAAGTATVVIAQVTGMARPQ